jgi:uncharacterized damage-inducible protein DinB
MSLQKLIANYAAYNEWANKKIVNWLQQLDIEQLYIQGASSFNSIDATLQHMLRAQRFWQVFICGRDTASYNWAVREREVELVMNEILSQSQEMKVDFGAFTEAQLEEELTLNMPWSANKLCRYEYIMHVVNHSTYHRGQIITLARSIGVTDNLPGTDYNFFNSGR